MTMRPRYLFDSAGSNTAAKLVGAGVTTLGSYISWLTPHTNGTPMTLPPVRNEPAGDLGWCRHPVIASARVRHQLDDVLRRRGVLHVDSALGALLERRHPIHPRVARAVLGVSGPRHQAERALALADRLGDPHRVLAAAVTAVIAAAAARQHGQDGQRRDRDRRRDARGSAQDRDLDLDWSTADLGSVSGGADAGPSPSMRRLSSFSGTPLRSGGRAG